MLQFKNPRVRTLIHEDITAASFMQQHGLNKVEW